MGDDDGPVPAVARPLQLGLEPGAAGQRLVAHRLGVERPPAPRRLHQVHEVAAGAHRLGPADGAEQVEVAPAGRADDADARGLAASLTTRRSRSSIVMPRLAQRSRRAALGDVEVAAVELVVAGDEDDRLRPAAKALERRASALSMSPARTSSSAPGAGSGSYDSVSRCRSERSCSRIQPRVHGSRLRGGAVATA